MTIQSAGPGEIGFRESVRLPMWAIGLLGLVLGVTAGVLTGVAVKNLASDEPLLEGSGAAVFYLAFGFAVLLDLFVMFNFTFLVVTVVGSKLEFRYGLFGKSLTFDQIKSVEPAVYRWITYGGWGIRFSTQGRRAWSQIGVKRGVVVEVEEDGQQRRYFVSSRRPEELLEAISARLAQSSVSSEPEPEPEPPAAPGSTES